MVRQIINIPTTKRSIPTSTEITVSTALISPENLGISSILDTARQTFKVSLQIRSSQRIGSIIMQIAITPYIPTVDLSKDIEEYMVEAASESAAPATGTEVPTMNFTVFIPSESAVEFMAVCIPKIPVNSIVIRDIPQFESFLRLSETAPPLTSGDTLSERQRLKYPPVSGKIQNEAKEEIPSAAKSNNELIEAEVAACPESMVTAAKLGTNPIIKTETPFMAETAAEILCHISLTIIPAPAKTAAKSAGENRPLSKPKAVIAEVIRIMPISVAPDFKGRFIPLFKNSVICIKTFCAVKLSTQSVESGVIPYWSKNSKLLSSSEAFISSVPIASLKSLSTVVSECATIEKIKSKIIISSNFLIVLQVLMPFRQLPSSLAPK